MNKQVVGAAKPEKPPQVVLPWSLIVANTIVLMLVLGFIYGFGRYLFRVLLPEIRADIGFDYATAGGLNALSSVGYLPVALLAGWLRDRIGAVRLLLAGCVVCVLSLLAFYQVSSVWMLGVLLALLGASAAAVWVPIVEVVGRFMPKQHKVKALGLITSGPNLGILVNGLLAPIFIAHSGWRPLWLVVGLISAVITGIALILMRKTNLLKGDRQVASVASTNRPSGGIISRIRSIERRFFVLASAYAFIGLFGPTFTLYFSAYMRDELAMSAALVGQAWSALGLIGICSGFAIGWLGDRIGIRRTIQIAIGLDIIATLLVLHHAFAIEFLLASLLIGLGFFPLYGLVAGYISKYAPPEQATFIFGLMNVVHNLSIILGSYLGGILQASTGTFFWTYMLILCCAAVVLAITTILPEGEGAVSVNVAFSSVHPQSTIKTGHNKK